MSTKFRPSDLVPAVFIAERITLLDDVSCFPESVLPRHVRHADELSRTVRSRYCRRVADLPLSGGRVRLLVRTRRFTSVFGQEARAGRINFDDINSQKHYCPMEAYSQSKLACLMFALELQDRSRAAGWGVSSIAAHPGISRTDLLHNTPGRNSLQGLAQTFLWFLFQPVAQGALPQLFAATSKEAKSGGYYGPDRLGETCGHPQPARIPPQALDRVAGKRLWEL
jgi:NAD(P)-dependent dehydrogenase (short-subunit alcohol dehydrogenase family)